MNTIAKHAQHWAAAHPTHSYLEDARAAQAITYQQLAELIEEWGHAAGQAHTIILDIAEPLTFGGIYVSLLANGKRVVPVDPHNPWGNVERVAELLQGVDLIISDRIEPGESRPAPVLRVASAWPPHKTHQKTTTTAASIVMFTSGSTGTPKGVELTEAQLMHTARAIATHNQLTPADRGYNPLPLSHINAQIVGLLATLVGGATLVLDKKFHRTDFWNLLAGRRITWCNAVPAILAILAHDPIRIPPTLRFIRSASSLLPDTVRDAFGDAELVVSYGMTEGGSQITATPLGAPRRAGSVGLPVGVELQIRDEHERQLGPEQPGMIWLLGPGIINSYLFNRNSERFDADGWLMTGDIGKTDADGYVYLLSRADDLINRGGEKLYPSEVEDVLLQAPQVREAVVVAKPHDILGQVPVAFIIPNKPLDALAMSGLQARLFELCEVNLPKFKQPLSITIVEELPRTATGKVQRVQVRQLASA